MTPGAVRRALHAAHALTSVLLIATGLLLGYPDLRSALVGGYGRQILDGHLWIAWGFLGASVVAGAAGSFIPVNRSTRHNPASCAGFSP